MSPPGVEITAMQQGGTWKGDECRLCPSDMRFFEHESPFNVLDKALKVCNSLFTRAFGLGQGVSSRDPHRIRETTSEGNLTVQVEGAFEHEQGVEAKPR